MKPSLFFSLKQMQPGHLQMYFAVKSNMNEIEQELQQM